MKNAYNFSFILNTNEMLVIILYLLSGPYYSGKKVANINCIFYPVYSIKQPFEFR